MDSSNRKSKRRAPGRASSVTRWLPAALTVAVVAVALPAAAQEPFDPTAAPLNQGPKPEAVGEHGMVSTQLRSSTEAAVAVLERGGNAIDAALTALFLQQVHDYHMVFLFGSMSAIGYDAASGEYWSLNAISGRPAGEGEGGGDPMKVAIGGTIRGAGMLADRFGTVPWAELIEPAVAAAEEGAMVTSFMYGLNFAEFESGGLANLQADDEARRFYMPDGHLVPVGERWKMPALAETLRRLAAEGPDYMYGGEWGRKFVEESRAKGGKVSLEDMAAYAPTWDDPIRFTYRGRTILGSPPPDYGAVEAAFNLKVLERFDLAAMGHWKDSPETLAVMARAMDRVRRETAGTVRDPLTWRMPLDLWLSDEYGALVAEYVRQTGPRVDLTRPMKADGGASGDAAPGEAGVSTFRAAAAGAEAPRAARIDAAQELGSDHIVVADRHGNWISMLHTIHGGTPGVFIDGVRATGSGFGGSAKGPGRRLALPISAIIVQGEDGRPWLALGTPGNPPQPVTEVLVNILDFGMHPKDAAEAPRFFTSRTEPDVVQAEMRFSDAALEGLKARGVKLETLGDYNFHTGSFQIVWRGEDGRLHGVSDPRRLGWAEGH